MYAWSLASNSFGVRTTTVAIGRNLPGRPSLRLYDRGTVAYGPGTTERERYATALADLWDSLSATLARLDAVAGDSQSLDAGAEQLPVLQNRLHWAGELVAGIEPPHGAERSHAELSAALERARDATGRRPGDARHRGDRRGVAARPRVARRALHRSPGTAPARPRSRAAGAARGSARGDELGGRDRGAPRPGRHGRRSRRERSRRSGRSGDSASASSPPATLVFRD